MMLTNPLGCWYCCCSAGRGYLLVRVWGRKYSKHLPKLTSNWYFKTGLHTLLYSLMLAVPLSGYWLSNAYHANNISLFGLPMPDLFPVDAAGLAFAGAAHSRTSKVFAILNCDSLYRTASICQSQLAQAICLGD